MALTTPRDWNLRGLSVIAFGHGASDFYSGVVPLIIFYVVTREHLSPAYQGAIGFAWYFTSSIVQPLFGYYSDRAGRWWFLPSAVLLTAASISVGGAVHSVWLLAACIVAGGFGSAIMHPEAGKYSAMLSGRRKAGGISIFQVGGSIGFALGPLVIGLLLTRFGERGSLLLLAPGALAAAALFLTMRRVDRSAHGLHRAARAASFPVDRVDRFGVALLVGSTALRHFVGAAFMTFLPNLLTARGLSLAGAGELVTAFLLVSALGMMLGGYLGDRFGAVTISVASLCCAVPFLFGFFAFPGGPGIVCLLAGSVLLAVQNAPGVAIVQAMLPRNLGMALGLMNGVAFGIGSALVTAVGFIAARYGPASALEEVSVVPLLSAVAYLVVSRRLPALRPAAH